MLLLSPLQPTCHHAKAYIDKTAETLDGAFADMLQREVVAAANENNKSDMTSLRVALKSMEPQVATEKKVRFCSS